MTKRRIEVNGQSISGKLQNAFDVSDAYTLSSIITGRLRKMDDDMWRGMAVSFMTGLIEILAWKRDNSNGEFKFDISVLESYINIKSAVMLSLDEDIPLSIRAQMITYLNGIPGMNDAVKKNLANEDEPDGCASIYRQHGFITMQLTESINKIKTGILTLYVDKKGHMFKFERMSSI